MTSSFQYLPHVNNLLKIFFFFCKCRTKIILYCQVSDIILVTHSLRIQIMVPAADDTFYVNNINMNIEQTSYNSVMLLLPLES